jgi:hypothetical protein
MALRKPSTTRLIGLNDIELAEALGISLERLVDALNEAGLCRRPGHGALQEERSRVRCAGAALPAPRVAVMPPPAAQGRGFHLGFHLGLS